MTIEQTIGFAAIGILTAWISKRPWPYYIVGAAIFVACGYVMVFAQSKIDEGREQSMARHMTLKELNAFACGVVKARGEQAQNDTCDKFKDLRP